MVPIAPNPLRTCLAGSIYSVGVWGARVRDKANLVTLRGSANGRTTPMVGRMTRAVGRMTLEGLMGKFDPAVSASAIPESKRHPNLAKSLAKVLLDALGAPSPDSRVLRRMDAHPDSDRKPPEYLRKLKYARDVIAIEWGFDSFDAYLKGWAEQSRRRSTRDTAAIEDLLDAAWAALEAGKVNVARDRARAALAQSNLATDAFAVLGYIALGTDGDAEAARDMYDRGVRSGEQALGLNGSVPHEWAFWLDHDTRPFMRCLHGLGLALWRLGAIPDAIDVFRRLLSLYADDPLGARYSLVGLLYQEDRPAELEAALDTYFSYAEPTGEPFSNYARILLSDATGEFPGAAATRFVRNAPLVALNLCERFKAMPEGLGDDALQGIFPSNSAQRELANRRRTEIESLLPITNVALGFTSDALYAEINRAEAEGRPVTQPPQMTDEMAEENRQRTTLDTMRSFSPEVNGSLSMGDRIRTWVAENLRMFRAVRMIAPDRHFTPQFYHNYHLLLCSAPAPDPAAVAAELEHSIDQWVATYEEATQWIGPIRVIRCDLPESSEPREIVKALAMAAGDPVPEGISNDEAIRRFPEVLRGHPADSSHGPSLRVWAIGPVDRLLNPLRQRQQTWILTLNAAMKRHGQPMILCGSVAAGRSFTRFADQWSTDLKIRLAEIDTEVE